MTHYNIIFLKYYTGDSKLILLALVDYRKNVH